MCLLPSRRVLCTPYSHHHSRHFMQNHRRRVHACLAVSRTKQPCTMSRHFMQSHIRKVHACLAVTRTKQTCTMSRHFMQSHIRKVHACLAVTRTKQPCTMSCHFVQSHIHKVHACLAVTRTKQPYTMSRHFMQSHIRKVHVCLAVANPHHTTMHHVTSLHAKLHTYGASCLAVTCHLHALQNDRDLLRATAITRGWNGYPNQAQHRKLTLEEQNSSAATAQESNPSPFQHESGARTT